MKRTTVVLTDELAMLIEREGRRSGVSAATVVRDALGDYFSARSAESAIIGISQSNETQTARDMEEILAREWTYERLMGIAETESTRTDHSQDAIPPPPETDRSVSH